MAQLMYRPRTVSNWTPVSYTAGETDTVINVGAGDLCAGLVIARTRTVFNGSGTDAIIIVGDDGDTDRFGADGFMDETTTGLYVGVGGSGSTYAALGRHLYTAANTIDIVFTANTAGTRTTGTIDLYTWIARAVPN